MLLFYPCITLLGSHLVIGQSIRHVENVAPPDWPSAYYSNNAQQRNPRNSIHGFPPEMLAHVASPKGLINQIIDEAVDEYFDGTTGDDTASADYNEVLSERNPYLGSYNDNTENMYVENGKEGGGVFVDEAKVNIL